MDKKEEIQYKNKMGLVAFLFFCGGAITGGLIERIDTNNKQKEMLSQGMCILPNEYLNNYELNLDTNEDFFLYDSYGKNIKHFQQQLNQMMEENTQELDIHKVKRKVR